MASYIETTPERTMEVSVGFMTSYPEVGHLEFVVHHSTILAPTQQDVLIAIAPDVLRFLGGQETDWFITSHDPVVVDKGDFTYTYSFNSLHLDSKARTCPFMRTSSFRPHIHRFTVHM
jgi:hypothetical protein